jgi:hypothetical protein
VISPTSKSSSTGSGSTTTANGHTRRFGNLTPSDRYQPPAPIVDGRAMSIGFDQHGEPIYPPKSIVRSVSEAGKLTYANKQIQVGRRFAGTRCRIVAADGLVHIHWGEEHIRSLTLDPTTRYQGASVR